jgi:hypothetical protein
MKKFNSKLKFFLLSICLLFKLNPLFSQDFYINQKSEVIHLNYVISPQWINLNINESNDFLINSGFSDVKSIINGNKEIVSGRIPYKEYIYIRELIFENKIIKEYSDKILFIQGCGLCFANEAKLKFKYNPDMLAAIESSYQKAKKSNDELKEIFYHAHLQSLKIDDIQDDLSGDISDFSFNFSNSINTPDRKIVRNCNLKLDEKNIYNFISERKVIINDKNYFVGNYNLKDVNQYDLNSMIDVFFLDCKNHNINIKKGKVISSFETLDGKTLGLSYGINNDTKIELRVDPAKWEASSIPKRWYLSYHELGHDVLNLKHGNGGRMMFNFADRGYSWKEFWDDRNYMFESYKRK